jgi:hypothetical protein
VRLQDHKEKKKEHENRHHPGRQDSYAPGAAERIPPFEKQDSEEGSNNQTEQGRKAIEIAPGQSDQRSSGAAQEHEGTNHHEHAQEETDNGGGTSPRFEFPENVAGDEGTEYEPHDLGTKVLHDFCAVQSEGPRNVTVETGDADPHVGGIAPSC